jgi:repressor of nif and glnA expression
MPTATTWNDKAHLDLLKAIWETCPPNTSQWEAVSDNLRSRGYEYTRDAVRYAIRAILELLRLAREK